MSKCKRNLKIAYRFEGKRSNPTYSNHTGQSPCWLLDLKGASEKSRLGKSLSEYKAIPKHSVIPAGKTNKRDITGAETI